MVRYVIVLAGIQSRSHIYIYLNMSLVIHRFDLFFNLLDPTGGHTMCAQHHHAPIQYYIPLEHFHFLSHVHQTNIV